MLRPVSPRALRPLITALLLANLCATAFANNPRWVTGPPYFTSYQGRPVRWYNRRLQYFTDPGDLSSSVNHAAADAIVNAAMNVWNRPTADIMISYGGPLAEHVSSANTYLGSSGLVFPADVQSSNASVIPIAVIYDTDGSVTDTLLGQGASGPLECLQNAVTESVDSFSNSGDIQHAVLILNGRCTGPAPEQQLQLQYQLERAFGRILGVGWSQTNDNVFTRSPQPTYTQALHWPIMHPIDIVCGPYTYQCLPNPFTLRDDDVAALSGLYLIGYSNQFGWTGYWDYLPGRAPSYNRAAHAYGSLLFPNGQGMAGVNLVLHRKEMFWNVAEDFEDTSSVSGMLYQQNGGNPITGPPTGIGESMGEAAGWLEGYFDFTWIPMIDDTQQWVDITVSTQAVNPLYTGSHAVGPYVSNSVTPSGVATSNSITGLYPDTAGFQAEDISFIVDQAVPACNASDTGTESAPQTAPTGGWWTGVMCGYGHTAWFDFNAAAGHTATIEITALDENGLATQNKIVPLVGLWNVSDPTGTTPTVALTPSSFNTVAAGTTALPFSGSSAGPLRMAIADARGDGRPDYAYRARILYADSVQPATVPQSGGLITITGSGFRPGNQVLVDGVAATVSSWTDTTITALVPASTSTLPVDITVQDLSTHGTTTIPSALTYTPSTSNILSLVSAPSGTVAIHTAASPAFAVRAIAADGITPIAGVPVTFTFSGATLQLTGCAGSPCGALTDSTGLASVIATPSAFGSATLQASAFSQTQSATFAVVARAVSASQSSQYIAAGATVSWTPQVMVSENGIPVADVPVSWTGAGAMQFLSATSMSSISGVAQAAAIVGPLAPSATVTGQVCGWVAVCTNVSAVGVDPAVFQPAILSGAGQSVHIGASFAPISLQVTDSSGHAIAGATVIVHQVVDQAQMPCTPHGACPIPSQLAASTTTIVTDINGQLTLVPLQVSGSPAVTNITITTGTQGFLSFSLTQNP